MYSPPPVAVAAASPKKSALFSLGPILAGACLLFLLLAIATAIILSLIPVYTPNKGAGQSNTGPTYYVILTFPGNASTDGVLSQANLNAIARAIEVARGLRTGSVVVVSGSMSSTPVGTGKRKRRADDTSRSRRGTFAGFNQQAYLQIQFNPTLCPTCGTNAVGQFQGLTFPATLVFLGINFPLIFTIASIGRAVVNAPPFAYTTTTPAATTPLAQ